MAECRTQDWRHTFFEIARATAASSKDTRDNLRALLVQHAAEWRGFVRPKDNTASSRAGRLEDAMADLNQISAQRSRRLRIARENAGIRQDDGGASHHMSRPTPCASRRVRAGFAYKELQESRHHYGVPVNALLRREAVHTDLVSALP